MRGTERESAAKLQASEGRKGREVLGCNAVEGGTVIVYLHAPALDPGMRGFPSRLLTTHALAFINPLNTELNPICQ